jgi:hypothetical protein
VTWKCLVTKIWNPTPSKSLIVLNLFCFFMFLAIFFFFIFFYRYDQSNNEVHNCTMQKIISRKLKRDLVTYEKTLINEQESFKKIEVIFSLIFFWFLVQVFFSIAWLLSINVFCMYNYDFYFLVLFIHCFIFIMLMLCCSILQATTCALKITVEHPRAKENIVLEHSNEHLNV